MDPHDPDPRELLRNLFEAVRRTDTQAPLALDKAMEAARVYIAAVEWQVEKGPDGLPMIVTAPQVAQVVKDERELRLTVEEVIRDIDALSGLGGDPSLWRIELLADDLRAALSKETS